MHFVLHGNLDQAVGQALRAKGHQTHLAAELALSQEAGAVELLKAAQSRQWDVVTNDPLVARAPYETPVRFGRSLVYLQLQGGDVEQDDAIDRLLERYKRLTPRRLYTVTGTKVKVRQLPAENVRSTVADE